MSPEQSADVKAALKNSRTKHRIVQNTVGEVLTSEEVVKRLKEEEDARKAKQLKKNPSEQNVKEGNKKKLQQQSHKKISKQINFECDDHEASSNNDSLLECNRPIITGSWVAVNYQSECGQVVKEYRGQVTAQDARSGNRYSVKFLTKCKGEGHLYIFPDKDDIEWVDEAQICEVFSVPDFNGRYFKCNK